MKRTLLFVLLAFTTACLPIPCHRNVLVRPAGTIRVVDAKTRAPISGATVNVARYRLGPPPHDETHNWNLVTGSAGSVSTSLAGEGEWVMPLMMHGVPQWAWEVCADAPGYGAETATWIVQREWSDPAADGNAAPSVVIALSAGTNACASRTYHMQSYPPSVTGVDHRYESEN